LTILFELAFQLSINPTQKSVPSVVLTHELLVCPTEKNGYMQKISRKQKMIFLFIKT
jgi:hypothetical protein